LISADHEVGAVVVNRTSRNRNLPALRGDWGGGITGKPVLMEKLGRLYSEYKREADAEKRAFKKLGSEYPCIPVPEINNEVTGLRDLHNLREYLFG